MVRDLWVVNRRRFLTCLCPHSCLRQEDVGGKTKQQAKADVGAPPQESYKAKILNSGARADSFNLPF